MGYAEHMRIGVVTTGYPHDGDPVAGAFVREMSRALASRGHAITVVCASRSGDRPLRDAGVTVKPVDLLAVSSRLFYSDGAPEKLARCAPGAWIVAGLLPPVLLARARRD